MATATAPKITSLEARSEMGMETLACRKGLEMAQQDYAWYEAFTSAHIDSTGELGHVWAISGYGRKVEPTRRWQNWDYQLLGK